MSCNSAQFDASRCKFSMHCSADHKWQTVQCAETWKMQWPPIRHCCTLITNHDMQQTKVKWWWWWRWWWQTVQRSLTVLCSKALSVQMTFMTTAIIIVMIIIISTIRIYRDRCWWWWWWPVIHSALQPSAPRHCWVGPRHPRHMGAALTAQPFSRRTAYRRHRDHDDYNCHNNHLNNQRKQKKETTFPNSLALWFVIPNHLVRGCA